ncbi:response regulator [Paenibacillus prosopidis]|uniref:YesN/AraC family two-component response regulator n=1 Tax=Paenibacillus prosopidis TaxID=630520 RepID=A0A368VKW6_9BACL|nr:helix-turn-helix domain-containing protein [Paenibacillus prosopidis]RCW40283.1 YesN/AraC family two-component response regulator [Paenibacillus prosopidis]
MYRILLVDDEPLIRLAIKSLGYWELHGFEIACEAYHGADALEKFQNDENGIDLILTDITMPKMNGLELIREIRCQNTIIPIIVLSSFNDFKFVREAFQLGIQDYVLKSEMDFKTLLSLFKKANHHGDSNKKHHQITQKSIQYYKQNFLENNVIRNIQSDFESQLENLNMNIPKVNITVAALTIDNYKTLENNLDALTFANIIESVYQLLLQKTEEFNLGEVVRIEKSKYAFISGFVNENSTASVLQKVGSFLSNVKYACGMLLNVSLTIGISDVDNGYDKIPMLYRQAVAANNLKIVNGKGNIYFQQNLIKAMPLENYNETTLLHHERDLMDAMMNLDVNRIQDSLTSIFMVLKSQSDMKKVLNTYLSIFLKTVGFLQRNEISVDDNDISIIEVMDQFETIEEIHNYIKLKLLDIYKQIQESLTHSTSKINIVKEYVRSNYYRDISLKSVSEYIHVSDSYLSRLFSSTGETFISYLRKIRIEKAKELLKKDSLTIQEVSEAVGYANQEHFSRIFKKYTGYSPNRFRNGDLS